MTWLNAHKETIVASLTAVGLAFAILGVFADLVLWKKPSFSLHNPRYERLTAAARMLGWLGLLAALIAAFWWENAGAYAVQATALFVAIVVVYSLLAIVVLLGILPKGGSTSQNLTVPPGCTCCSVHGP